MKGLNGLFVIVELVESGVTWYRADWPVLFTISRRCVCSHTGVSCLISFILRSLHHIDIVPPARLC